MKAALLIFLLAALQVKTSYAQATSTAADCASFSSYDLLQSLSKLKKTFDEKEMAFNTAADAAQNSCQTNGPAAAKALESLGTTMSSITNTSLDAQFKLQALDRAVSNLGAPVSDPFRGKINGCNNFIGKDLSPNYVTRMGAAMDRNKKLCTNK
ncbi:MAG: hypothetical protein ACXVB9_04680 [Bdellovibrionota bacterium]